MQLILDIEESNKEIVLNIINNLKEGIINKYHFISTTSNRDSIEAISKEEETEIKEILQNMSEDDREVIDIRKYSIKV